MTSPKSCIRSVTARWSRTTAKPRWRRVKRSIPEVVIVGLELPAVDGLEVARRLREGYGKQMRLIANTAWPDNAETNSKAANAGFDDVLIKPTQSQASIGAIGSCLRVSRRRPPRVPIICLSGLRAYRA